MNGPKPCCTAKRQSACSRAPHHSRAFHLRPPAAHPGPCGPFGSLWRDCAPCPRPGAGGPPFEEEGRAPRPAVARLAPAKPIAKPIAKPLAKSIAKPGIKTAPHHGPAVKNDNKRYLRSLDEDHDGRVTHKEFLARNAEHFDQLDANHNGRLTPAELGRTAKTFAKLDANGDGHLTRKEFLARREQGFAQLDVNRDGALSRQEAKAAKLKILHRRAEKKAEKKATALRMAERQTAKAEKDAARLERARKREERAAEKQAKAERRMAKMTEKARAQWQVLLPPPDMTPAGTQAPAPGNTPAPR